MAIFSVKSHTVSCCTYNQLREKCLGKLEDEWHKLNKETNFSRREWNSHWWNIHTHKVSKDKGEKPSIWVADECA